MRKLLVGMYTTYGRSGVVTTVIDVNYNYDEEDDKKHEYAELCRLVYQDAVDKYGEHTSGAMRFDPRYIISVLQVTELGNFKGLLGVKYVLDGELMTIFINAPDGYDALSDISLTKNKFEDLRDVICGKLKSSSKSFKYRELRNDDITVVSISVCRDTDEESDFGKYHGIPSLTDEYAVSEVESILEGRYTSMRRMHVSFILKYGTDRIESAVIYMPEGYDHTKDIEDNYNPMESYDCEENHLYPALRQEIFENRKRWGKGSMYKPENISVLSITFLGHADRDISFDVEKMRIKDLDEEIKFGPAAKMIGTGV